jgi:hypothetical protein
MTSTTTTRSSFFIVLATMIGVPLIMLLVFLTHGAIEPHLPGQAKTWNIQYSLHLFTAVSAALLALRYRSVISKVWLWIILASNALWAALAVYAIFSLWGDMY